MGQEQEKKIRDIIERLKDEREEIAHVLVTDKNIHARTLYRNQSPREITLSTSINVAMQMIEVAMKNHDMNCEGLTINTGKTRIIVRRAYTAIVIVEVMEIIPSRPIGILTDDGPNGTIKHINDAVEKIKMVLSE